MPTPAAPMTAERFASGLTLEDYHASMVNNRERYEAAERATALDRDDLAAFQRLPDVLPVLVLDADWCDDGAEYLPVLGRLAAESRRLDVRVFPRDEHDDLMQTYLSPEGHASIPVFVVFDPEFRELGRFIERPAAMHRLRRAFVDEFHALFPGVRATPAHMPAELRERAHRVDRAVYDAFADYARRETVRELRAIIELANLRGLMSGVAAGTWDRDGSFESR